MDDFFLAEHINSILVWSLLFLIVFAIWRGMNKAKKHTLVGNSAGVLNISNMDKTTLIHHKIEIESELANAELIAQNSKTNHILHLLLSLLTLVWFIIWFIVSGRNSNRRKEAESVIKESKKLLAQIEASLQYSNKS